MTDRIMNHKILGTIQPELVPFRWNGEIIHGAEGESLAAALLANGIRTLRRHEKDGKPRGIYCNIGHCSECRVTVNGERNQRACLTPVEKGMDVEQQTELPHLVKGDDAHV
ncbi:(2Fe-2S)-binding protein [Salinicoccus carnicancri]|uniref:(2Fe-2S)-binding protein n=1 Tax=Salinicoccus carnicancri TaxID=558170 RepID=UPI000305AB49|nr:(2Fe-2S)-binding protein [Salinicoccus carnicancri]